MAKKKSTRERLDEALNVANQELQKAEKQAIEMVVVPQQQQPLVDTISPEGKEDYKYVRATYYQMIESGKEAVQGILELAQDSELPRPYEVAGLLMKTVTDMATALIDLEQRMANLKPKEGTYQQKAQLANTEGSTTFVFAGTTSDLSKMVEEARRAKKATEKTNG